VAHGFVHAQALLRVGHQQRAQQVAGVVGGLGGKQPGGRRGHVPGRRLATVAVIAIVTVLRRK